MAWDDDSWRDTYDEWKLRSPYDEGEWEECDHEEYEIAWDGRAHCSHCATSWAASGAEIAAYDAFQRRAEIAWRREHSWYMRAWRWLKDRFTARREKFPTIDSDIPF